MPGDDCIVLMLQNHCAIGLDLVIKYIYKINAVVFFSVFLLSVYNLLLLVNNQAALWSDATKIYEILGEAGTKISRCTHHHLFLALAFSLACHASAHDMTRHHHQPILCRLHDEGLSQRSPVTDLFKYTT